MNIVLGFFSHVFLTILACGAALLLSFVAIAECKAEPQLQLPTKLPVRKPTKVYTVPDELLVIPSGTADKEDFQEAVAEVHGTVVRTIGDGPLTVYVVQTEKGKIEDTEKKLAKDENVACVQRNFIAQPQAYPNDPYYPSQWHIPGVNAASAWTTARGSGQTIAILDTGSPANGVDLGGKSYSGYDAVLKRVGQGPTGEHGSMVATTAAAITNNGRNTAGVAPDSRIFPVKVCDSRGSISEAAILEAIYYCGQNNIKIINMSINADPPYSFSNRQYHPALHIYADWYHNQKNGLLFIAAGNNGQQDTSPRSPNMIVVSAINNQFSLASFSTYGSNVWFTAPGQGIYCTNSRGQVSAVSGTSFSSPCAAAVAALAWSANPNLRNTDVERILVNTCYRAGSQTTTAYYGYGMPNAAAAVAAARR